MFTTKHANTSDALSRNHRRTRQFYHENNKRTVGVSQLYAYSKFRILELCIDRVYFINNNNFRVTFSGRSADHVKTDGSHAKRRHSEATRT